MPSFEKYKERLNRQGSTLGEVRKWQADQIMDATWDGDIASQVGWFFDMYHDPDPRLLRNMKPTDEMIPIDVKFINHVTKTYDKDYVTQWLQFKPSQPMSVPYYEEYEYLYDSEFPLGLYVLLKDERGRLNRFLIVDKADSDAVQFPTWEVLRCDYTLQYIYKGERNEVASVLRSQNSYNAGVWTDYKVCKMPPNIVIYW